MTVKEMGPAVATRRAFFGGSRMVDQPTPPAGAGEGRRCIACQQEIPAGASLCSVCKSYQRGWKNHLQYGAGIVAIIVVTFSAAAWLWGNAGKLLWPHNNDVRVVSASSLSSAVILNRGDNEVFVSHLILTMPGRTTDWVALRLVFEERLPSGQFVSRKFPESTLHSGQFVHGLNAADFDKLIARAAHSDPCVELVLSTASDSLLRETMQAGGPTLNTFGVGGYLEFLGSNRDAATDVPVTGRGMVRRDMRPECK
jgi:hypothetical protein